MPKVVVAFLFLVFNLLFSVPSIQAYQPPGMSNCPDLPQIPISVSPTSGTQTTRYQVTLLWEDLSPGNFSRYRNTDVNIYIYDSMGSGAKPISVSGDTIDPLGRLQKNADHFISDLAISGNPQVFVRLNLNGNDVCRGYEVNTVGIQLTGSSGSGGGQAKVRGDYCDPNLQTDPVYRCPDSAKCEMVAGSASGNWACGGVNALCQVQGICVWGGNPTPTSTIEKCDTQKGNCNNASGSQCNPQTGSLDRNGEGIMTAIGCIPTRPTVLIDKLLKFGIGAGGGIALLMMVYASFMMITSAGNPDSLKKAHDQFINAVIGLLFIIFAVMLLKVIGVDILQIPGFQQ